MMECQFACAWCPTINRMWNYCGDADADGDVDDLSHYES
jgi:hypothetical protein